MVRCLSRISVLCALVSTLTATQAQMNKKGGSAFQDSISYVLHPIPLVDRVNLEVVLTFAGSDSGTTQISLPADKYGTPKLYQTIASFEVKNAEVATVYDKPHLRTIYHQPHQRLEVHYVLSFEPERSLNSSFSPIMEPSLFHFFYPQWLVRPTLPQGNYKYTVAFNDVPSGWIVASNLEQDEEGMYWTVTEPGEFKPFIAGGDYQKFELEINQKPVNLIISHHFQNESLPGDVEKLLTYQRKFFDFEENEHYLVSITFRKDILAGTGIENAFVCLLRTGAERRDVLQLLAHETLHNWIPLMADIYHDESVSGAEYATEFFNEGITSYAPRVLLFDQGLITRQDVVDLMNETLLKYARNPHNTISLVNMMRAVENDAFTPLHEKISYYRGELLGYKWDHIIRQHTRGEETILHFVKKVIAKAIETDGVISFEDFFAIASEYGIDAERDWKTHIEQGQIIRISETGWLEKDYELIELTEPFYDAGFNVRKSKKAGKAMHVIEGSAAYNAGLRNGMKIQEMEVSKSKEEPFELKLSDEEGAKHILFYPSKIITYEQIVAK